MGDDVREVGDDILEAALGRVDRQAHLGELVVVLDEPQLAQVPRQAGVEIGDVGVERPVLAGA